MCKRFLVSAAALLILGLGSVVAGWPSPGTPEAKLVSHARENPGDVEAGHLFLLGNKLGCVSCHGVPGQGGNIGPDLKGVGARYDREQLMKKVLNPSPGSAMPGNLAAHLQPTEFANLIAYLEHLQ